MTSFSSIPTTTTRELIERYDALLIDAYGVLIHQHGAIPGASALIDRLNTTDTPYFVLTNDASRSQQTAAKTYQGRGLAIEPERIITSGSLLSPYFAHHNLQGAHCVVLGPQDSKDYVEQAGGIVVSPFDTDDVDVVAACDDAGFPFLETIEAVLSLLCRRYDAQKRTHLLLPNPDLIYPKSEDSYGFTSGSIALLIEHALQIRYLHDQYQFVRLGKPHTPIFERAFSQTNTRNMVMLGDQLRTDICGANSYGIDSALVSTGLVQQGEQIIPPEWRPTYLLPSLEK